MAKITTITNPLTGQPAQVDQLDHTAQQIDDGLNIARGVSNPNLLDNWYFGNPVDQRGGYVVPPGKNYYVPGESSPAGQTEKYYPVLKIEKEYNSCRISINGIGYAVVLDDAVRGYTGAGYGIDRWKNNQAAVTTTVNSSGYISIVRSSAQWNALIQLIENWKDLAGKTVTISVLLHNAYTSGDTCYIRLTSADTETNYGSISVVGSDRLYSKTMTLPSDISSLAFSFYVGTTALNVKAAKLELGSTQTLAHQENGVWVLNEIPNYGEQLARCQRYFTTIQYSIGRAISTAVSDGNGEVGFPIYLPTTIRVSPVFTHTGTLRVHGPGIDYSDVSISAVSTQSNIVALHVAGLSPMTTYTLDSATGGVLNFSADL